MTATDFLKLLDEIDQDVRVTTDKVVKDKNGNILFRLKNKETTLR